MCSDPRSPITLILALLLFWPVSAFAQLSPLDYGWTLSASSTDPFENVGPAVSDTLSLYLWLTCARPATGGVLSARLALSTIADLVDFAPSPGVGRTAEFPADLDLTFTDCPTGLLLVGRCRLWSPTTSEYVVCLQPSLPNLLFGTIGCATSSLPRPGAKLGYRAGGSGEPCSTQPEFFSNGSCVPNVGVDQESWGRIKGSYNTTAPGSR